MGTLLDDPKFTPGPRAAYSNVGYLALGAVVTATSGATYESFVAREILAPLGQVEYEFSGGGKLISKTVHHFLMRQVGGELTVENDPQQEAVGAQWFD